MLEEGRCFPRPLSQARLLVLINQLHQQTSQCSELTLIVHQSDVVGTDLPDSSFGMFISDPLERLNSDWSCFVSKPVFFTSYNQPEDGGSRC